MEVFFSKLAEKKLLNLSAYLLENWNIKVRNDFVSKLTIKILQISKHPQSCPQSKNLKNLYKCVVTKQTTFYYSINFKDQEIEIITIFDTRQHPNKLKKDI